MWTRAKVALYHYIPVVLVGLAVMAYLRWAPSLPTYTSEPGPLVTATEPKVVEKVVRVTVPGPTKIVYLDRPALAAKLEMPELKTVTDNVLSVATVPPHTGPTTAIATLSPEGVGGILLRKEPPKFFQLKREWGVRGGIGTGGLIQGELYARPLRIGPVELEARAFGRNDSNRGADFGALLLIDVKFQ